MRNHTTWPCILHKDHEIMRCLSIVWLQQAAAKVQHGDCYYVTSFFMFRSHINNNGMGKYSIITSLNCIGT